MATMFRVRKDANNAGSGGKIVRGRRVVEASPYSRPSTSENPNRLMRFISPASRVITGAAKMISTVFFPDTPPTSSSEDDSENDDDISDGDDSLNQNAATSEANAYTVKNLQLEVPQNEIKPAIEQLLMQETFSRDECNKLVKIIESRVVEFPARKEGGDAGQHPGVHGTDICNTALLEAKRWVEEKNRDSYSQLDRSRGSFSSNPSNFTDGELGSPVLMAKSYMKSRPPWTSPTAAHSGFETASSPTAAHSGFQTASPIGMYVSNEETPHAIATNAMSSSKDLKRRSLVVDSPDSLDGSRRVRFKIAEDKVRPLAACENSQEAKTNVEAEKRDAEFTDRINYSDSLSTKGYAKQSAQLSLDSPKNNGCSVSEGSGHVASSISLLLSDHNQSLEGAEVKQERSTIHAAADIALETHNDLLLQEDYAKQKETNSSSDRVGANGFVSVPRLSARVDVHSSPRANNEDGQNIMTTSSGNWEGSCELLSEFSIEIPKKEEANDADGTIISSSKQSKEQEQEQRITETPAVSSPGMKRRSSTRVEKQVVKKATNPPSRRGRGRGRGK